MKMWRVGYGRTEEIEVISRTPKTIVIQPKEKDFHGQPLKPRRVHLASSYGYKYYDTKEEAHADSILRLQQALEYHQRMVVKIKEDLEKLK